MNRYDDWPGRLEAYMNKALREKFDWRTFNCAIFCCGCIESMTGVNPSDDFFKDKYETPEQAYKLIKKFCDNSQAGLLHLCKKMADTHGMKKVDPAFAQRGSVVLFDIGQSKKEYALGVIALNGRQIMAVRVDEGLVFLPLSLAEFAWSLD